MTDEQSDYPQSRNNTDLWLAFVGLLYGLIIAHATFGMVGGGHGWGGAIPTAIALFIAPVLGEAWRYRGRPATRIVGAVALALMALANVVVLATLGGASIIWKHMPVVLVYWALMWTALHVLAAVLAATKAPDGPVAPT